MEAMGFKIDGMNTKSKMSRVIPPVDFQHVLCEGATGSGKTASLILPTLEDRLKRGHTIIFFDHKGHEHKKVKHLAKKAGRLKDVVEIGKPHASYINLLAELDTIRLKDMVREQGMSKDPYWSNSAANLVEDIIGPLRKLHDIVNALKEYRIFKIRGDEVLNNLKEFGIDIYKKPSFQILALIVAFPKKLSLYKDMMSNVPHEIERILEDDFKLGNEEIKNRRQILAKVLSLKKNIESASRFVVSEDKSDTNTGNNAVLQTLDNTISSYAKKDYINIDEYTIATLIDSNAIIIIDTQSFGDDVMKLFLESILKKAVMRLRTGTERAMSVFVDEANRVLFPSIDLHNDVLREAAVELIIAIQNEEQMVSKFSQTVWDSIKNNIKHQYLIDIQHRMTYNDGDNIFSKPLLLPKEMMNSAEYDFHALEKNQSNIMKHFLGETDVLPDKFLVVYDLDMFEHESSIVVEDKYGEQYLFSYHGEEIVNEVRNTYPVTMIEPSVDIDIWADDEDMENEYNGHEYTYAELMHPGGLFDEEYDDEYDIEIDYEDDIEF